ncbi:hypothetical protein B9Z55_014593 [Caenorhabditis nigoni]|uniref:Uncharacterized protein n=1 Tax=Caenorhabditis nigoni TaxID=1611254 RepID=A0A2G5U6I7_9PELO|nr:hypothetical protein B9Z55_014593 [Caenorhabditis nigoni]
MASPNSKNNHQDVTDGSSTIPTDSSTFNSGSGSSSSPFETSSTVSTDQQSRHNSFDHLSSPSLKSINGSRRRRSPSSGSHSDLSCCSRTSSDVSSKKKKRSFSKKIKKSPKKAERPIGQISMIKQPVKDDVRGFISKYSVEPEFEAFSLTVDGIPFVAVSLMNADKDLLDMLNVPPPTPMKKHTPGVNNPRKRLQSLRSRSSSVNSKHVSFADEESSAKKSKKSLSNEDFRELGEQVSDAMINNERQYNDLWKDRAAEK